MLQNAGQPLVTEQQEADFICMLFFLVPQVSQGQCKAVWIPAVQRVGFLQAEEPQI